MARFSIVVPAYNAEHTLSETLESVLAQEFGDWECIVVDDGSTDSSLAIAQAYSTRDPRVSVLSQPNQGTADAYNTGVSAAIGDFVVICSADDVLLPGHLRAMAEFIGSHEDYDIYSSNGFYWRVDGSRELVYGPDGLPDSLTFADLAGACFYGVGAAYRRKLFDLIGGYRSGIFGEDYDFWLRAMAAGARHRYLSRPLSLHRISATQKSAQLDRAYCSDIEILRNLKKHSRLSAAQRGVIDEEVQLRRQRRFALRYQPLRAMFYRAWVVSASPLLGEENARRAPTILKSFVRKHLPRSGRF